MALTTEQREGFDRNGYLILRGQADAGQLERLQNAVRDALGGRQPPFELETDVQYPGSPEGPDAPGGDTIRRLLDAYDRDPEFRRWAEQGVLVEAVSELLRSNPVYLALSHHNCVMTKHPEYSSETHWHQDSRYWSFQQANLISAWLALGTEVQANGGMQVIPGTHRISFDRGRYDEAEFLRPDLPENQALIEQAVLVELNPGDLLLFHSRLFHAAGRNLTDQRKFALVYTYRGADNPPVPGSRSAAKGEVEIRV